MAWVLLMVQASGVARLRLGDEGRRDGAWQVVGRARCGRELLLRLQWRHLGVPCGLRAGNRVGKVLVAALLLLLSRVTVSSGGGGWIGDAVSGVVTVVVVVVWRGRSANRMGRVALGWTGQLLMWCHRRQRLLLLLLSEGP